MKKKYQSNYILLLLICLLTLYLINSSLITKSILDYTSLFIEKIFPASFLFFTLSSLLIDYHFIENIEKLLKVNGAIFYTVMMSLISGFPSGSKYIKDLLEKGLISDKTANYLITFTHFPNPMFILGSVSLLFPSSKYAKVLLFSLIAANLLLGLLLKPKQKEALPKEAEKELNFSTSLAKAITSSLKTILLIYGTSIFFFLIATIINHYINLSLSKYIFVNGIFDLTKGIFLTSLLKSPLLKAIFIIFFISFGGLSVNIQIKSIIADTKIKYKNFLLGRLFQFVVATIIFLLIINW